MESDIESLLFEIIGYEGSIFWNSRKGKKKVGLQRHKQRTKKNTTENTTPNSKF